MAFQIQAKITGVAGLLKKLDGIKRGARNRILRPTLAKAARLVAKDAKKRAPKDTGALRRSITAVIRTGRKEGNLYAVIGPETGVRRDRKTGDRVKTRFGKWLDEQGTSNRPANYAHLVEHGRAAVRPKGGKKAIAIQGKDGTLLRRGAKAARPKPFLRPALTQNRAKIRSIIREGIMEGLAAYHEKQAAKARGE